MNKQIAGTDLETKPLEEVIMSSWNSGSPTPGVTMSLIFENL
jgi:hypothetical protein